MPVDAVLDLHGHTQRTAYGALLRFVTDAHAHGARCLLVITGKGAPSISAGISEHSRGEKLAGAGRGVLRSRFAGWLEEEPLRRLVSRASPAHQRHGGAGAFYIFLKR
jgi:DNA-nicking Smr family endonuclease